MESRTIKVSPGEISDVFPEEFTTPPPYPTQVKYGQLDSKQFQQFFEEGYVLVENFFTEEELVVLQECKQAIADEVEKLAQKLFNAGKIKKLYDEYGLFQRLTEMEREFPGTSVLMHKLGVLPKSFCDLWCHPKLLNVVEQLLGTANINADPNWNLRAKTPQTDEATVPWHQDNGYSSNDVYNKLVITAWIPFLDTNEENGCMQVLKRGHRKGKVATHKGCWRNTWYIYMEEEDMATSLGVDPVKDNVTCPVPYGGILLFSNMLPHRSLNNTSNDIRWSIDLRWLKTDIEEGYFGVKNCLQVRSADDPIFKLDWTEFAKADRQANMQKMYGLDIAELEPILAGPWIEKWELVHRNKHTDAYEKAKAKRR